MAGGTVVLAHKSGGPLMDIVTTQPEDERTGYLANDIGMLWVLFVDIVKLNSVISHMIQPTPKVSHSQCL